MQKVGQWVKAAAVAAMLCSGTHALCAQDEPATSPSAAPVRQRHVMLQPPGFVLMQARGFSVLHLPEDAAWVRLAIDSFAPATQPTTMPQDLLSRVAQQRAAVEAAIRRDFAAPQDLAVAPLFDQVILPQLQTLEAYHVPLFYLVTTKPRLRDLVRSGEWSDPSFYYNRAADEVLFTSRVSLDVTGPGDDAVLPVVYDPQWDEAKRRQRLAADLHNSQADLARVISGKAQYDLHVAVVEYLLRDVFGPMKLPPDQRWLALGTAAYLSCDYAEMLSGAARRELLAMVLLDNARARVAIGSVDLLHPQDETTLRRQFVAAYKDAYRRKAILVVRKWLEKGGRESLPRVLAAMRQNPPASGADLLELIKKDCGADLSADAAARQ